MSVGEVTDNRREYKWLIENLRRIVEVTNKGQLRGT